MRIDTLYLDEAVEGNPYAEKIFKSLEPQQTVRFREFNSVFQNRKYLSKREHTNVIVTQKHGELIKEAPRAYGYGQSERHYYHIHAYNCVYECQYCFLQGYFKSPDLVFFVNHDQILQAIEEKLLAFPKERLWLHSGEFSDSLALSHISGELPLYFDFFRKHTHAFLELRTKSSNLSALRRETPSDNIIVSFSLSGERQAAEFDALAPRVTKRIDALSETLNLGYRGAIHFDPIIFSNDWQEDFENTVKYLRSKINPNKIIYVSLGVVRFSKVVFQAIKSNYPASNLLARHYIIGEDHKVRYVKPFRLAILETAQEILKKHGFSEEQIYFCME